MQGKSHEGMMFSSVWSLVLFAFIRVINCVEGWADSVCASVCTALLCQLTHRFLMCLFL